MKPHDGHRERTVWRALGAAQVQGSAGMLTGQSQRACLRREVPIDHEAHGQRGSGRGRRAGAPMSAQESRRLSFGGMRTQSPKRTERHTLVSTLRPSAERT